MGPTGTKYKITALILDMIVQTLDKHPPQNLLQYSVNALTEQGLPGYERIMTNNFQPRLGGNVEILIGNDLKALQPVTVAEIHDGFYVIRMRARLYDVNCFLGFSGMFPRGMEPSYQLDSHPKAVHYADHPQQADHEMQSVFREAASAPQNPYH